MTMAVTSSDEIGVPLPPWQQALAALERLVRPALRDAAGVRAAADDGDGGSGQRTGPGGAMAAPASMAHPADPVAALIAPLAGEARLGWLRNTFGLDELDAAVIVIAMAPECDLRFERLYAVLQDDGRKCEARVDLCLNLLCHSAAARIEGGERFAPDAALVRQRILQPLQGDSGAGLNGVVRLDAQIIRFLLYQDMADPRLEAVCCSLPAAAALEQVPLPVSAAAALAARFTQSGGARVRRVFLRTDDAEQARLLAGAVGTAEEGRVVECDMRKLTRHPDGALLLRIAFREAWLRALVLHLCGVEALVEHAGSALHESFCAELEASAGTVLLSGDVEWAALGSDAHHVCAVDGYDLDVAARKAHWRRCVDRAGIAAGEAALEAVAQRFRLRPGQIARAAAMAGEALGPGDEQGADSPRQALFAAARAQSGRRLAALATRIRPRYTWRDLVLAPDALAQLREICARLSAQDQVLERWGFARRLSQGKGTTVLFAGPSGTGKTMTAEIIASELGLDLYRINLAQIVSKYIGETEKNLDRVFDAARDANAVLLFDEAEALFGKRSEVRDAHDRYANIEVAYLLQRIEAFDGLAILSTNLRQNLDEAFSRRLAFVVSFPFPEAAERRRIWDAMFPSEVPLAADVDFAAMAERFKLSGGNIKNIALAAAFLAADERTEVAMRHLLHGTRREFQKQGKSLTDADLHLVRLGAAS